MALVSKMFNIRFGDFVTVYVAEKTAPAAACTKGLMAKPTMQTIRVPAQQSIKTFLQEKENEYNTSVQILDDFVRTLPLRLPERKKNTKSLKRKKAVKAEKRRSEYVKALQFGAYDPSSLSIGLGKKASSLVQEEKEAENSVYKPRKKQQRARKTLPKIFLCKNEINNLIRAVSNIARKKPMEIEIAGKHTVEGVFKSYKGTKLLRLNVNHLRNEYHPIDLAIDRHQTQIIKCLSKADKQKFLIHQEDLQPGTSGFVFSKHNIRTKADTYNDDLFIMQGVKDGMIIDARNYYDDFEREDIQYYAGPGERFWSGFERTFVQNRPKNLSHQCASDLDVEECGVVAAIVTQALFPCGRITCNTCVAEYVKMDDEALFKYLQDFLHDKAEILESKHPTFKHMIMFLKALSSTFSGFDADLDALMKIQAIVGDKTEAPFTHLKRINSIIGKGMSSNVAEKQEIPQLLLEIARYLNNRTDSIERGELHHFRNKISGKSHMNFSLMCDNQLDKNGNFQWGEREYHAKRFFNNYFEEIDPSRGYEKYALRTIPNGSRKLAIQNLIVSMNLDTLRRTLEGESINRLEIAESCVSRRNGGFVYPCCCVTNESGKPEYSEVYMPTQRHLKLGNTGDTKLVDLPASEKDKLYIAKNGYCYINIFLAMLVNVPEKQAKDFTKMVRDNVVERLGTWPSLMDVASCCYMLTLFFPDVSTAELPRILVDHEKNAMHVLDSYGSIATGYHILKANTVSQLIGFASYSLNSDMKHYIVGGEFEDSIKDNQQLTLSLLIKSVYKPRLMCTLLKEDPYLILLSVLSPSVLIAMHRSGSFDRLMDQYVEDNVNLATAISIMDQLAQKVSQSKTLERQFQVIHENSEKLLTLALEGRKMDASSTLAVITLSNMHSEFKANKALRISGYSVIDSIIADTNEKRIQKKLQCAWNELSWSEKLSATKESFKLWLYTPKSFAREAPKDTKVTWRESCGEFFITRKDKCKNKLQVVKNACLEKFHIRVGRFVCYLINSTGRVLPDLMKLVNTLIAFSIILNCLATINTLVQQFRMAQLAQAQLKEHEEGKEILNLYRLCCDKMNNVPTKEEFIEFVESLDSAKSKLISELIQGQDEVEHQGRRPSQANLERIIAFISLALMMFDSERSDCVYKSLNKLRSLMNITENEVKHQSLDDITNILEDKELTIDFELDTHEPLQRITQTVTFDTWFTNQLNRGNVQAHYRTGGVFLEFTRETAASVANTISHDVQMEFLIRGAVGSGKSTGLPFHLSKKGKVLMLEPTRPLAENVSRQLNSEPFLLDTTLQMRGYNRFGASPITVMTSGYALHSIVNHPNSLRAYDFVIFDECHVNDSSAMAFRCLLKEYEFSGKIIKVSATPPGKTAEFTTQHPVKLKIEEQMTLQTFADCQGRGVNADVVQDGNNILVYVASYNEVDQLAKLLIEKGHKVTKIDGRTMKTGSVEIVTEGTQDKKHFIVATNIIENGITIDIDVVVDFGMKVVPELDIDCRQIRYNKQHISYGERIQRLGRVGRHKKGTALRIGKTETGLPEIPPIIATEAALLCFAYGLPVMPQNVTTSIMGQITCPQAKIMLQFELSPFFMYNYVRFDGTMHAKIHECLKDYKLRTSEILLSKFAIPNAAVDTWMNGDELRKSGVRTSINEKVRIPFYVKDIPEKLYEKLWDVVCTYKSDAGFGRLTSAQTGKIAYTLQTDLHSIPSTLSIIEQLIQQEQTKQNHFESLQYNSLRMHSFSLASLANAVKAKYMENNTAENLHKLNCAKAQLLEFSNLKTDANTLHLIEKYPALKCVYHQSSNKISEELELKGKWKKSLITKDLIVLGGIFAGGAWMIFEYLKDQFKQEVRHQGMGKRQRAKLKFRDARDKKIGREVYGDDGTMEHYFGEAYTSKGRKSGRTRGTGRKDKKFINMYGFDPNDFSSVRFVDPITGCTVDDNVYTSIREVQEHFGEIRNKAVEEDLIDSQLLSKGIEAYYMKDMSSKVLKIDLTPHNPFAVTKHTNKISGYPEKEGVLRQTGDPVYISPTEVPPAKSDLEGLVIHESKSMLHGVRDYNPISSSICKLTNVSNGYTRELFGLLYGGLIITNQHLFEHNNGTLYIKSRHGEFVCKNTKELEMIPIAKHDILIIRMPSDFPVSPMKLRFREPIKGERICMVGSNFQQRSYSSTISETSAIFPQENSTFWLHWISTKDGQCGYPMVSTTDGWIIGVHSLTSVRDEKNYFVAIPKDFETKYLQTPQNLKWVQHWQYNPDLLSWGALWVRKSLPGSNFKITKLVSDLNEQEVRLQSSEVRERWMYNALGGNLKAVAQCPGQLVTKHTVKGKCQLFSTYMDTHPDEKRLFLPYLSQYDKSRLNKEAFVKDITKYATDIRIGEVDCEVFEQALSGLISKLERWGFEKCEYVTSGATIINSLNMKSAVGALYSGKKKDYFEGFSDEEKEQIVKDSCCRLFMGKMGIWNGSLKSELRPIEKVKENKTRTFTAAPVDTLLGAKVCVDDFNNQFYDLNIKCPWSVGMTKFYGGWNELMNGLPDGWLYCDADGSRFDSSLSPYLINAVLRVRLHFMEKWDIGEQMLRNLYTEIVYTPIATPDGTIIKKFKGNNSGQPSTVVDNTLMVILAVFYTLLKCGIEIETYEEYFRFFANGDDLILAVIPEKSDILESFEMLFEQLGLHYDFTSQTFEKSELWFMSHRAIECEGIWIPKLEEARIISILEWDRSVLPEHRLEAICASMIEAWGYPWLVHEIRKFYQWVLEQAPYSQLAKDGKAPYIAETALRKLYTNKNTSWEEIEIYLRALEESDENFYVNFVTSNENKFKEVEAASNGTGIIFEKTPFDIVEIQGTRHEIAMHKAIVAYKKFDMPVLIEDTALEIHACGNMPGPYVKHFTNENLMDMAASTSGSDATAWCTFAYCDGKKTAIIEGSAHGKITAEEVGNNGFGWDTIFQDRNIGKTYAEMTLPEKNAVSHRGQALKKLREFLNSLHQETFEVRHQANDEETKNAGSPQTKNEGKKHASSGAITKPTEGDVNLGSSGMFKIPRVKQLSSKLELPKFKGKIAVNLDQLLLYKPKQNDISNTYATQIQFDTWYNAVMQAYEITEEEMPIILNGLMVWCIENGTSPDINGEWTMMDGEEQISYSLKPIVENAKPTLRQVMAHCSDLAEAYIVMRNTTEPYMPRYGLQRNLNDMSLARYAFDFYKVTSKTPARAREAHFQMKAAALRGAKTNLFGLDGNVGEKEENTERHTTGDVNRNMHTLLGVQGM